MEAINDHGERLARLALANLPKGTWTAYDFVDSDGVDLDRMVKLNVTVTVIDDEMVIDWSAPIATCVARSTCRSARPRPSAAWCSRRSPLRTHPLSQATFRPLRIVSFGGHAGGDGADGIMHLTEPGCRSNPVRCWRPSRRCSSSRTATARTVAEPVGVAGE